MAISASKSEHLSRNSRYCSSRSDLNRARTFALGGENLGAGPCSSRWRRFQAVFRNHERHKPEHPGAIGVDRNANAVNQCLTISHQRVDPGNELTLAVLQRLWKYPVLLTCCLTEGCRLTGRRRAICCRSLQALDSRQWLGFSRLTKANELGVQRTLTKAVPVVTIFAGAAIDRV